MYLNSSGFWYEPLKLPKLQPILDYYIFLELYYGGEVITVDQPQSFTCPYCGRMGFTDVVLQEHVCAEHPEMSLEVVSLPSLKPTRA